MFEVGRLCVKIAGRDASKKCVIVDVLENNHVLIDGETRRRKCNIVHLEPLDETIEISKKASHDSIVSEFKKLKLNPRVTKPKQKTERPIKKRKTPEQLKEQREKKKEEKKKASEEQEKANDAGIEKKLEEKGKEKPAENKEVKAKTVKPKTSPKKKD
jgi:large subunit ribosomal protein L14e|tara:strand:- start:392 stop:865 length:474 start_codon:yes stop_codon:yes gene_type:complete